jgi:hypothetical protein
MNKGDGQEAKDEEGLQLKLTRYGKQGNTPPRVEIIDKSHAKMTFQKRPNYDYQHLWNDYWLISVEDSVGNTVAYKYQELKDKNSESQMKAAEGKLESITDGTGRKTTFAYDENDTAAC